MEQSGFTGSAVILGHKRFVSFEDDGVLFIRNEEAGDAAPLTNAQALQIVKVLEGTGIGFGDKPTPYEDGMVGLDVDSDGCLYVTIGEAPPYKRSVEMSLEFAKLVFARQQQWPKDPNAEELRQQSRIDDLETQNARLQKDIVAVREMQTLPAARQAPGEIDMLDIDVQVKHGQIALKYGQQTHKLSSDFSKQIANMVLTQDKPAPHIEIGGGSVPPVTGLSVSGQRTDLPRDTVPDLQGGKAAVSSNGAANGAQDPLRILPGPAKADDSDIPFGAPEKPAAKGDGDWVSKEPDKMPALDFTGDLPPELMKASTTKDVVAFLMKEHNIRDLDGVVAAVQALKAAKRVACVTRISGDVRERVERAFLLCTTGA